MNIKLAISWSLITMAATMLSAVWGLIIMRLFTNQPLSDNATVVIKEITGTIGAGLISILSMALGYYFKSKTDKKNESTIKA